MSDSDSESLTRSELTWKLEEDFKFRLGVTVTNAIRNCQRGRAPQTGAWGNLREWVPGQPTRLYRHGDSAWLGPDSETSGSGRARPGGVVGPRPVPGRNAFRGLVQVYSLDATASLSDGPCSAFRNCTVRRPTRRGGNRQPLSRRAGKTAGPARQPMSITWSWPGRIRIWPCAGTNSERCGKLKIRGPAQSTRHTERSQCNTLSKPFFDLSRISVHWSAPKFQWHWVVMLRIFYVLEQSDKCSLPASEAKMESAGLEEQFSTIVLLQNQTLRLQFMILSLWMVCAPFPHPKLILPIIFIGSFRRIRHPIHAKQMAQPRRRYVSFSSYNIFLGLRARLFFIDHLCEGNHFSRVTARVSFNSSRTLTSIAESGQ